MTRRENCLDCNIFHDTCNGKRRYVFNPETKKCKNQVTTPNNAENALQVEAFRSLYKVKKGCGVSSEEAFVEAIVQTSDDAYERAKLERGDLIKRLGRRPATAGELGG